MNVNSNMKTRRMRLIGQYLFIVCFAVFTFLQNSRSLNGPHPGSFDPQSQIGSSAPDPEHEVILSFDKKPAFALKVLYFPDRFEAPDKNTHPHSKPESLQFYRRNNFDLTFNTPQLCYKFLEPEYSEAG